MKPLSIVSIVILNLWWNFDATLYLISKRILLNFCTLELSMQAVIYLFLSETHPVVVMWLILSMTLFLPVPYLYDTKPWFKFRLKVWQEQYEWKCQPLKYLFPSSVSTTYGWHSWASWWSLSPLRDLAVSQTPSLEPSWWFHSPRSLGWTGRLSQCITLIS